MAVYTELCPSASMLSQAESEVANSSVNGGINGGSGSCGGSWKAEEVIAGNVEALTTLREMISWPLLYSRQSETFGKKWPRGLLLYGPLGTGKRSLVRAVACECNANLIFISPHSVHRSDAGESEKYLREAFAKAESQAKSGKPSVIFIDEIDALCPRRDSRRLQDVRISSQISLLMDSNYSRAASGSHVIVVASTNRVDAIDPALRRAGRFDAEVEVSIPNGDERLQILKLYTKKLSLDPNVNLEAIAASCKGFVGADLEALCREALMVAVNRFSDVQNDPFSCVVRSDDWEEAKLLVSPSITRGITVEIPKVSWEDIGGLKDLKKKLQQAVEWRFKHTQACSSLGILHIRGILLHGPPGCSKTTLAKAAACAAQASFFSLCGADLYSMYVGEGEALLRNTFRKARLAAPSIIFFDEADVVGARRGGGSTVAERLVTTLLTEMDGLEQAKGVLVLAATNRPHAIDPALMRAGRFDLVLYVPTPDMDARYEILCVLTRKMKVDADVDLRRIAQGTDLFTGAELDWLCQEAGAIALREDISAAVVSNRHFRKAMRSLRPSLTREEIDSYADFQKKHKHPKPSSASESSSKLRKKGTKNLPLLAVPITISALGLVFCGVFCYISFFGDYSNREQATKWR